MLALRKLPSFVSVSYDNAMGNDEIIARLHRKPPPREKPLTLQTSPLEEWLKAVYGLLIDIRRNLPAFIASSEERLEPITFKSSGMVGRGRKMRMASPELSAGWRLSELTATTFGSGLADTQQTNISVRTYLLLDGRLFRNYPGETIPDEGFAAMLAYTEAPKSITRLYARAKLTEPPLPQFPDASLDNHYFQRMWENITGQEV
jgi:hypothetical protein